MKEIEIKVPCGIRYISQWQDYFLPKGHCIVDKGVTGCGYTEYCLTNSENVILCSPRKLLLENKRDQHKGDSNILYLENSIEDFQGSKDMKTTICNHILKCTFSGKPVKFMVTYDSLHYISEYLLGSGEIGGYTFVIDEFQSIFMDAFFKPTVEFDLVEYLQDCPNVVYLSATPMMKKYLERVSEFKDLDFYKLNWDDTGYVEKTLVKRRRVRSLGEECGKIVDSYLSENFEIVTDRNGNLIESKEAVFYMNSLTEIIRVITSRKLTPKNTIILCSAQPKNVSKLKRIGFQVGKVPLKDEPNPMFMFCTSATYVGVDMYSKCARTFVFSDPNLKTAATDIVMDLPQIAGRQRDTDNPFKNEVSLFYKITRENQSREAFDKLQDQRRQSTKNLLEGFQNLTEDQKLDYIKKFKDSIKVSQYSGDFVSISKKTGLPVYNSFIELADERAWEVEQVDYQDSISVTRALDSRGFEEGIYLSSEEKELQDFLDSKFYATGLFHEKMKLYCEFRETHKDSSILVSLDHKIPDTRFKMYYEYYGTSGCKSRKYREIDLYRGWKDVTLESQMKDRVYKTWKPGDRVVPSEVKSILQGYRNELGISGKAKATDLGDYFKLIRTRITLPDKTIKDGFKLGEL